MRSAAYVLAAATRVSGSDRNRLRRVAAAGLTVVLVALSALGALTIWHLMRRGRMLRARLTPKRVVEPLDPGAFVERTIDREKGDATRDG